MTTRLQDGDHGNAFFGRRVAGHLTEHTLALPHGIEQRLRVARLVAMEKARLSQAPVSAAAVVGQRHGAALIAGVGPWWNRVASTLPLIALVAGLVSIQHLHSSAKINTVAEIDVSLLADDLPPAAYGDPGFLQFLKMPLQR